MHVHVIPLIYWKSEHDVDTNEDSAKWEPQRGLFAIADGVGTASFANIWSKILTRRFVEQPLPGDDPFEVECWLRPAQDEYRNTEITRPEAVPAFAQEKAREGSRSTLATVRFTKTDEETAECVLLAIGDSDIFIARHGSTGIEAFPLDNASQFDARPLIFPTRLIEFDRNFHRCKTKPVHFSVDDVVVLATDAVSKWILSATEENGARKRLEHIARLRPDAWPSFIDQLRQDDAIIDDDSTALVLCLTKNADDPPIKPIDPYDPELNKERIVRFDKAVNDQSKELAAIWFGDGRALGRAGYGETELIRQGRQVADALTELRQSLQSSLRTGKLETAHKVWYKHRDLLKDEPDAETLKKSLVSLGISLQAPPPPEESPKGSGPEGGGTGSGPSISLQDKDLSSGTPASGDHSNDERVNQFRLAYEACGKKIGSVKSAESLAALYSPNLDLTTEEHNDGRLAVRSVQVRKGVRSAIENGNDTWILSAYSQPELKEEWLFDSTEWSRIYLAKLRRYLHQNYDEQTLMYYDLIKSRDTVDELSPEDRKLLKDALDREQQFRAFESAVASENDVGIVAACNDAVKKHRKFASYKARHALALSRSESYRRLRAALDKDDDVAIVNAYVPEIANHPGGISDADQKRIALASKRVNAQKKIKDALEKEDELGIVSSVDPALLGARLLSSDEHQIISSAFWKVSWLWRGMDLARQDKLATLAERFARVPAKERESVLHFWSRLARQHDLFDQEQLGLLEHILQKVTGAKKPSLLDRIFRRGQT